MPTNKVKEAIEKIIKFKTLDIVQTLADFLPHMKLWKAYQKSALAGSDDKDPRYHIITFKPLFGNV